MQPCDRAINDMHRIPNSILFSLSLLFLVAGPGSVFAAADVTGEVVLFSASLVIVAGFCLLQIVMKGGKNWRRAAFLMMPPWLFAAVFTLSSF